MGVHYTELNRFNRNLESLSFYKYLASKANSRTALFPDLTNFEHTSPCHSQATKMAVLRENYQQPAKVGQDNSTVAADSQVVNCKQV